MLVEIHFWVLLIQKVKGKWPRKQKERCTWQKHGGCGVLQQAPGKAGSATGKSCGRSSQFTLLLPGTKRRKEVADSQKRCSYEELASTAGPSPSPSVAKATLAVSEPAGLQLLPQSSASGNPVTSPTSLKGCTPCVNTSLYLSRMGSWERKEERGGHHDYKLLDSFTPHSLAAVSTSERGNTSLAEALHRRKPWIFLR